MSLRKRICIICGGIVLLATVITVLLIGGFAPSLLPNASSSDYESKLFSQDRIHRIEIFMDNWEGFLQNCADEEYASCSVAINGELISNVGIRAKGNSSLTAVAEMGSSRYSLKLEFDHYNTEQSYHGLDKLNLNNLIQDNTMMKDYLTYQMMDELGVPAPLCSYTTVYVNKKALGLYLAVEAIEESFLKRNYGSDYGELYKPEAESPLDGEDRRFPEGTRPERLQGQALRFALEQQRIPTDRLGDVDWDTVTVDMLPELLAPLRRIDIQALVRALTESGGSERNSGHLRDVKLQYIDDNPDSYPNIFENAKTPVNDQDKARLIQSLKQLSTGTDLKNAVAIEEVIRYFVVHIYVCNEDSYSGSTVHNYYLYEKDGRLSMLPWDYNLAFGGSTTADASAVINSSIFHPVSGENNTDRPMLSWILNSKKYTWLYRRYYIELLNMKMEDRIDLTAKMIAPYVRKDPTRFCTYEEFEAGVTALKQFLELRTESVRQQLAGRPADVDVGNLNLAHMGGVACPPAPAKPKK